MTKSRKSLAKREAVLRVAAEMFVSQGYKLTSIEAIAREATVSKVTAYRYFGSKECLFRESIRLKIDALECPGLPRLAGQNAKDSLLQFCHALDACITADAFVRLDRCIAADLVESPRLGPYFLDQFWGRALGLLSEILEKLHESRKLDVPDTALASEQLTSMIRGLGELERRFGQTGCERSAQRRRDAAVDTFLAAYAQDRRSLDQQASAT